MKKSTTSSNIKQRSWNNMSQMLDAHMPVAAPVPFLKRWYSLLVGSILLVALGYYFGRMGQFDLNAAVRYETRFVDSIIYHHEYLATNTSSTHETDDAHLENHEGNDRDSHPYQSHQPPRSMAFSLVPTSRATMPPFPTSHSAAGQGGASSNRFGLGTSGNTISENDVSIQYTQNGKGNAANGNDNNADPQRNGKLNMKLSESAPNMANTAITHTEKANPNAQMPIPHQKANKDDLVASANKQKAKNKKKFPVEPKDIADIYTSRNFKLMGGIGATYMPGGSPGYYTEFALSKRIFKRFYMGFQFSQMNVRTPEMATFQSTRRTHYQAEFQGNIFSQNSTWAQETLTIHEADVRQTGLTLQYEVTPKLSINASYLVMNVRSFNFLLNSTHTDSSHISLDGELVEARREKVYTMESGGERSGSSLAEYNMKQVASLEVGFDYQLSKHLSWNATFGTSVGSPFPVPFYWHGAEVTQGFSRLNLLPDIRYIKTGIRIHL